VFVRAIVLLAAFALISCGRSGTKKNPAPADAGPALAVLDAGVDEEEELDESGEPSPKGGTKAATTTTSRRPVRKLSLESAEVAAIFAKIPRLAELAPELRLYAEPYDVNVIRRRGKDDVEGWTFSALPVLWTPAGGKPHLVVTGKSGKNAFIVALERLEDGGYELASSIIFRNDPGPFVLAWQNDARERIHWSSCWKCSGEGGAVVARDEGKRVVIIHH